MKFTFRFQKILDFKVAQEEQAQQKLAYWVSQYNQSLAKMEESKKNRADIKQLLLNQTSVTGLSEQLSALTQYEYALTVRIKEIEIPLEKAREEYIKSKQDKEAFEILRKKEEDQFLYKEKKKMQHTLDEHGKNAYIKNKDTDLL